MHFFAVVLVGENWTGIEDSVSGAEVKVIFIMFDYNVLSLILI